MSSPVVSSEAPVPRKAMDVRRIQRKKWPRYAGYSAVGLTLLVGAIAAVLHLEAAIPTVASQAIWLTSVQRGDMVHDVLGQGTLVAEEVRWLTAKSNGRVEQILERPGAQVQANTVLLELSNSEIDLAMLEGDRQLAQAEAELVSLRARLRAEKLAQQSMLASLRSELGDARRRSRADEELSQKGFLSELERAKTRDAAAELEGRLEFERARFAALAEDIEAQLMAQTTQLERLKSIAQFRRNEFDALRVRAGVDGVLQELALTLGQTVSAGTTLAKVARPDRLKAEIRVPETQAKDLVIGQRASIDTRNGIIAGKLTRIDPAAQGGTVRVDVSLQDPLPAGARPDLNVDGVIEVERLENVLFMDRPLYGEPGATVSVFRVDATGAAVRTAVQLGKRSVRFVEIASGLREGERVILSDMSKWEHIDRIQIE